MNTSDFIILGAGAAGLMAAYTAAQAGLCVTVVDHAPMAAQKMRMSGGGMGNMTNLHMSEAWYVGERPRFVRSVLKGFTPHEMLQLLKDMNMPWEERLHGQIFCREPVGRFVDRLVSACQDYGVTFLFKRDVGTVSQYASSETGSPTTLPTSSFEVQTSEELLRAPYLLLALGSAAWPKAGATERGMHLAHAFRHRIVPPYPVLVPFVMPEQWPLHGLQGISVPVCLEVAGQRFNDPLLFTHRGISGPVVLQASCFWRPGMEITINFLPTTPLRELVQQPEYGRLSVEAMVRKVLPLRLVELLIPEQIRAVQVAQLSRTLRQKLEETLHTHKVVPTRTIGMAKAEAAAGGVDTAEVYEKTLESRKVKGLYFAGEVLDIAGRLGGYNIHWAFASGKAAARATIKARKASQQEEK